MAEHFAANLRYHSSDIRGGMQKKYAATVACMLLVLATFATIASLYVKTPSSPQSGFLYASGTSLMRDGSAAWDGRIESLRRFKDDVREVASPLECGIGLEGRDDVKVNDVIEAYVLEEFARRLS